MDQARESLSSAWYPGSWRNYVAAQQPAWPDPTAFEARLEELRALPALVFSEESRALIRKISLAQQGQAFILQMGNCAERFTDCNGRKIHNFLRIMLQMACTIEAQSGREVVLIGRIAGQYAKPRSADQEVIQGRALPSFRGDNVNGHPFDPQSRAPNPDRLLEGYFRSAATLNLIRAFWAGGYADVQNLHDWKRHYFRPDLESDQLYTDFFSRVEHALTLESTVSGLADKRFFCSHEALLLEYEEAFTRTDTIKGGYFNTAAHFLWIGDRTRDIEGAHIEYIRGIGNPIGVKVGPGAEPTAIAKLCKRLNPDNVPGRLTLITRMGANRIGHHLPSLQSYILREGLNVAWMCDPMHGNTRQHNGYKTRDFGEIVSEMAGFIKICRQGGCVPAGIHLEVTEEFVTECFGGLGGRPIDETPSRYLSAVDPRLNAAQGVELAMHVGREI